MREREREGGRERRRVMEKQRKKGGKEGTISFQTLISNVNTSPYMNRSVQVFWAER